MRKRCREKDAEKMQKRCGKDAQKMRKRCGKDAEKMQKRCREYRNKTDGWFPGHQRYLKRCRKDAEFNIISFPKDAENVRFSTPAVSKTSKNQNRPVLTNLQPRYTILILCEVQNAPILNLKIS